MSCDGSRFKWFMINKGKGVKSGEEGISIGSPCFEEAFNLMEEELSCDRTTGGMTL